jgi:hypothetical protein
LYSEEERSPEFKLFFTQQNANANNAIPADMGQG